MALKKVARSATVAFSPSTQIFAAGTMADAIDLSSDNTKCVELFGIDFTSESTELSLLGSATTTDRVSRLTWGKFGVETKTRPYGLLAGGLQDGSVLLLDPSKLASGNPADSKSALIHTLRGHKGAVRGLEFCANNPNILASGAEDGEVRIWKFDNLGNPTLDVKLRSQAGGEISFLSWNPQAAHILATTSASGNSVVWDLRQQREVISFKDSVSTRRRCSALQWNPSSAYQLIVASDEDKYPSVQVWDLKRTSVGPAKELVAHTKGVLAAAWCPHDSGLLLTCAKDNRTICWEMVSGEVLYELPSGNNPNFDLQWSRCTPGIFSTSSFDGQISLFDIELAGKPVSSGDEFSPFPTTTSGGSAWKRAPQWLKCPAGVSFGFGGKIISFGKRKGDGHGPGSDVKLTDFSMEEELVARSVAFEAAIAERESGKVKSYCEEKISSARTEKERETWSFLGVLFADDARTSLLSLLNFQDARPGPAAAAEGAAGTANGHVPEPPLPFELRDDGPGLGNTTSGEISFDNLHLQDSATGQASADTGSAPPTPAAASEGKGEAGAESEQQEIDEEMEEEPEVDEAIQRSLVVGHYEGAVDTCLAAGRMADALLIASVAGADVWNKTRKAYMKATRRAYMKVMECVMNGDLRELINARPVAQWKETLAMLCTYAGSDTWASLCDALAAKLAAAGDSEAAMLAYICAGNIECAVDSWLRGVPGLDQEHARLAAMQEVVERGVVLSLSSGPQGRSSPSLSALLGEYVAWLASQGRLATALAYLNSLQQQQQEQMEAVSGQQLDVLKDRIYRSGRVPLDPSALPPPFPFEPLDVQLGYATPQAPPAAIPAAPTSYRAPAVQAPAVSIYSPAPVSYASTFSPAVPAAAPLPILLSVPPPRQPPPSWSHQAVPQQAQVPPQAAPFVPQQQPPSRTQFVPQHVPQHQQQAQAPAPPLGPSVGYTGYQQQQQPMLPSAPLPMAPQPKPAMFVPQAAPMQPYVPQPAAPLPTPYTPTVGPPPVPSDYLHQPQTAPRQFQPASMPMPGGGPGPTGPPPALLRPAPPQAMRGPPPTGPPPGYPSQPPTGGPEMMIPSAPVPTPASHTAFVPTPAAFVPHAPSPVSAPAPTPTMTPILPGGPMLPPHGMPSAPRPAPAAVVAPPESVAQAPVVAAAPPPTVQTADTSNVAADLKPVVATLTRLFNETGGQVAANPRAPPAKKREAEDTSKKIGLLLSKLNVGDVSPRVAGNLRLLCQAVDAGDWDSATKLQVSMTTTDWDECGIWLVALKRCVKARQGL